MRRVTPSVVLESQYDRGRFSCLMISDCVQWL
nr:MAG TPA: hypothetical protein [Herelleviridae sp.]